LQIKLEDGEITEDAETAKDVKRKDATREGTAGAGAVNQSEQEPLNLQQSGWSRRDGSQKAVNTVNFMFFLYS
jgi:pinin